MKTIKTMILPMLGLLFTLCLMGCGSEEHESSTDPRLRVLGTWKNVVSYGWHVPSDYGTLCTFSSDGKVWRRTKQKTESDVEVIEEMMTFGFDDGWTYDEKTDEISGTINFTYTTLPHDSTVVVKFGFILSKKEMRLYGNNVLYEYNYHVFERQ